MQLCDLAARIEALAAAAPQLPVLVALDGPCGSGKTTLAARLEQQLAGCLVVHTDDFYLPPARRVPGWESIPCANMDLERLRREVLEPAQQGQPFFYRPYSCRKGEYLPAQPCPPPRVLLVEGSYSHHPALASCFALRVFLRCPPAEQARRLQAREGERYAAFVSRWIPLEQGYFSRYRVEAGADLVLEG